jgi:hypothetical protein
LRPSTGQDSLNFCLVRPPSEDDGHSRNFPISAVHTLRSFSLAGSRTASLQPLPPRPLPSQCAPRRPHSLRSVHRLWFDLRIGSEDPPACRMNTPAFISENTLLTDRQSSGQPAVLPTSHLPDCTFAHPPLRPPTRFFVDNLEHPSTAHKQVVCSTLAFLPPIQTGQPAHEFPDKCQRECCSMPRRSKGCPLALRRPERG